MICDNTVRDIFSVPDDFHGTLALLPAVATCDRLSCHNEVIVTAGNHRARMTNPGSE